MAAFVQRVSASLVAVRLASLQMRSPGLRTSDT